MSRHIGFYVLDEDGRPLPLDDADTLIWARWFESHDRQVALDTVGEMTVSTVFLGLDYNHARLFGAGGDPLLWETMIFSGPLDLQGRRYVSREAALAGHAELLAQAAEAAARQAATAVDEAARVGTAKRVGTKVGTNGETR